MKEGFALFGEVVCGIIVIVVLAVLGAWITDMITKVREYRMGEHYRDCAERWHKENLELKQQIEVLKQERQAYR